MTRRAWDGTRGGSRSTPGRRSTSRIPATGSPAARADAYGFIQDPIVIPAQGTAKSGDAGTLIIHYHLHGAVSLDVPGYPNDDGFVDFHWTSGSYDINSNTYLGGFTPVNTRWRANAAIDQTVDVPAHFYFGQPFAFEENMGVSSYIFMSNIPTAHAFVGYSEGDFAHTGTITGATVLDANGNAIADPQVVADSNFDYVNPPPVPEPGVALLVVAVGLTVRRRG